ncbi:sensor histidine kinase [Myroides sp. LJL116]
MIKRIFLTLLALFLCNISVQSQEVLDSLKVKYEAKSKLGTQRYYAAGQYISALFFNQQEELAHEVFQENIALALKEKDGKYAANLYAIDAMNQRLSQNYIASAQSLQSAISSVASTLDQEAKGYISYTTGWLQVRNGQEAEGVRSFVKAIEHFNKAENSSTLAGRKSTVYKELAAIYANWQEYELQEKYSLLALELAKEQVDALGIFNAYMLMGNMYETQYAQDPRQEDKRDLAQKYYLEAIQTFYDHKSEIPFASHLSFVAINLASLYLSAYPESYQSKVEYYANLAIEVATQTQQYTHLASGYGILAEIALSKGEVEKAKQYLLLSLTEVSKNTLGDLNIMLSVLEALADISEQQGNYKEALEYYKAYQHTFKTLYKQDQMELSKRLEAQFNKQKQEKELGELNLKMQKKEHELTLMQAISLQQKQEFENLKLRQENQSKELKLTQLESQKNSQELKLAQLESKARIEDIQNYKNEIIYKEKLTTYYIVFIGVFFLVLVLLSYALRQRVRSMRKDKELYKATLDQQKQDAKIATLMAILEGQEKERGRISRDLHDGLGGALSSTKIGLSVVQHQVPKELQGEFDKSMAQLDGAVEELRRIAHNLMPDLLERYGLKVALQDYATRMSREGLQVDVQFLNFDNSLEKDKELIVYRIIQELTNNALKHAKASSILIQLAQDNQSYHLTVEDDGVGFEVDKIKGNNSAGMHNIQSRIDFLKGSLHVDSQIGIGTSIEITF